MRYAKLGITHFGIEIAALFWHEFKALCPKFILSHVIVFFSLKVRWVQYPSVDANLRYHITHSPDDMSLESDG
jgi:hypothetical protein